MCLIWLAKCALLAGMASASCSGRDYETVIGGTAEMHSGSDEKGTAPVVFDVNPINSDMVVAGVATLS